MVELTNIFTLKNIIVYLLIINIIAFLAMLIDKKKAEKDRWRIKESTLLTLALIGGSIGAIAGMYTFHHKTKKPRFFIGIPVIIVLQTMLIIAISIKWYIRYLYIQQIYMILVLKKMVDSKDIRKYINKEAEISLF